MTRFESVPVSRRCNGDSDDPDDFDDEDDESWDDEGDDENGDDDDDDEDDDEEPETWQVSDRRCCPKGQSPLDFGH